MEVELSRKVPGFVVDPAMVFAYPTRLSDVYAPAVEQIYLPEEAFPDLEFTIRVSSRDTGPRQSSSFRSKAYSRLQRLWFGAQTLDFSGQFVFDTRFDTDQNPSHVIDGVLVPILYAKRVLSEYSGQDVEIHIILRKRASKLARQAYETLGIPIICTEENVFGNVVDISTLEIYNTIPQTFDIDIGGYNPDTPEKIFIPRRGNRSIINNDEVVGFLEERGFVTYYFEELTPSQQWSIVRNAKTVVAVHGAACGHLSFNRLGLESPDIPGSGLRILEIFSPTFVLTWRRRHAKVLNGRWCGVRGQITPESLRALDFKDWGDSVSPHESPMKDPFKVDLSTIQMALDHLEANP